MSEYIEILKKYWGYPAFRPLQEDIIHSVHTDRKDTLGLLPTGGGKSIIFQVPALASNGLCLVVTPLIALMKDQVENLKKQGIKAAAIYSGMTSREINITLDNCIYGGFRFLYLSPERLGTKRFMERLPHLNVQLLAIDEAHCISQWGYDFRPSYLKISEIREQLPKVPIIALTATATPEVAKDIQKQLAFREENLFVKSFGRKNLVYIVRQVEDKNAHLLKVANSFIGSGVVYVRVRKRTQEIAEFLNNNGVSADYYHAGLSNEWKDYKQKQWKENHTRVMVATNAFGMGIDKPDVRFVVHMDTPDSLEAYYQEAGRGGRDEKQAFGVLLYNKEDRKKLERQLRESFPTREDIKLIYSALGNYFQLAIGAGQFLSFDFSIADFSSHYKLQISKILTSLKFLQWSGYIEFTEDANAPSRVQFLLQRDDLYKLQVKNKQVDAFVKMILRSYSGLFTEYVNINEDFLAKKLGTTRDQVIVVLKKLRKVKVIDYVPQKRLPIITYTQERKDIKQIKIAKEHYEVRRQRMTKRIEAVLEYAESTNKCRSQLLLAYFGETDSPMCGQCDFCRRKVEKQLTNFEWNSIQTNLLAILKDESLDIQQISHKLQKQEDKIIHVIRKLQQDVKIERDNLGKFRLVEHN